MSPEQGITLLKSLAVHNGTLKNGEWVVSSCPLARWEHTSGKDTNPSFGLLVSQGTRAVYNCFACGKGSAHTLVHKVSYRAQQDNVLNQYQIKLALSILENEEIEVDTLPEYSEFGGRDKKQFQELPQYFIDSFTKASDSARAKSYLESRGVKEVEQWDIRYDSFKDMVVFPYRNMYGKLAGARGRAIESGKLNHYDYKWNQVNNSEIVWYNEQALCNEEVVVVVEGQLDAIHVSRAYRSVIANLTAMPVLRKMKKLQGYPGLVLIPDNDSTGEKSVEAYKKVCDELSIPLALLTLEDAHSRKEKLAKDPDDVDLNWIRENLKSLGLSTIDNP